MYKLDRVIRVSAGTTAKTVKVHGLPCLIQNQSADASLYVKEMEEDGVAASSSNGWLIGPGKETVVPMEIMELSIVASAASTAAAVLVLDMG